MQIIMRYHNITRASQRIYIDHHHIGDYVKYVFRIS